MEKNELLKILENAVSARENLDKESKSTLVENQITVLNRKLEEAKKEKDRVFQNMADAIMVGKNHLEAYVKIEKHLTKEIEKLKTELGDIRNEI